MSKTLHSLSLVAFKQSPDYGLKGKYTDGDGYKHFGIRLPCWVPMEEFADSLREIADEIDASLKKEEGK